MKKSSELKLERSTLVASQRKIADLLKTENRAMSADEKKEFDELQKQIDDMDEEIVRAEKFEENERRDAAKAPSLLGGGDGEDKEKEKIYQRFSITKALRSVNPESRSSLDGIEKEVHEIGVAESRAAKVGSDEDFSSSVFSLPMSYMRASQQTVSQDSGAYGGALVQDNAPRIVDPLRPRLFLEDLGATFLTGLTGGDVPLVVGADFTMEFLAEGASVSTQKKTIAGPKLNPKRAAGAVSITNRLLMQSSVDAQAMIMNGIRRGFVNLLQSAAINGAGGTAPTGLLSVSGVNVSTQAAAGAATWARIVELQALIEEDDATEMMLGYLIHPKVKAALKTITKDSGSGRFLLENGTIDGDKFISTSLVPTLDASGTAVYPIVYGDWAQLYIGQWGAVNIKVNPYSEDVADSVRLTLNTHADVAIANPKAFAKNAFISA
ncbi:phage major capsid protein [Flavobacterium sp. NRK1]|uniref:phage major capsid protein n=1 Tax=Flavobacterium sp. NRK1 TaxID=2954929 RepID=UPI00209278A7|nr:phage major capsid protein [Flavobacterium sp. NRK1]MCO6149064.1 phage major capsid protein [Flavobacterium sp. NRK1]